MKILWRLLALFKFLFLPPLAALGIWIITSFTSTMVRLIPWLIKYLMSWSTGTDANSYYTQLLANLNNVFLLINRVVYGLNGWFPVDLIINCFMFYCHFKFTMWFQRMYVKAITFGKV